LQQDSSTVIVQVIIVGRYGILLITLGIFLQMTQRTVDINVTDRKLKVACPIGQESALLSAAAELSVRLTKANNNKSIATPEQALLMTALNLTNELLNAKQQLQAEKKENKQKIALLQSTIEQALTPFHNKQA